MKDRLRDMLSSHDTLYGVICRDATLIDMELMAQTGYHVVWLDREHSAQSMSDMLHLARVAEYLGMTPMLRIPELSRTHVQTALDGGTRILTLPDVRTPDEARRFAEYGKYPPLGRRGVSTTAAGSGYALGSDIRNTLQAVNAMTRLMVMIESETGYQALDDILAVPGIDMLTIGPLDWATGMGLYGKEARAALAPRIEHALKASVRAGLIPAMFATDPELAAMYRTWGARILFIGEDVVMKRHSLEHTLKRFGAV
jgi:2-keto-3-deoxy-L-rhamnonate aldolase RhmA